MKRFATPLETIGTWEALMAAWKCYRSGKRRRPEVAFFEIDADRTLLHLSKDILEGRYRHGPYRLLPIKDPKPRLIAVAPVQDRIVHSAVYRALGPAFNKLFDAGVFACLEGRGSHRALIRYLHNLRTHEYAVHLDIKRYYPSIDHEILHGLLSARIRDQRVMALLEHVLESGATLYRKRVVRAFFHLPPWQPGVRPTGLPIGNLTSQWWGNFYLNELDHFIKRTLKVKGYLRYMDDLVCFGEHRRDLKKVKAEIEAWLGEHRRLQINVQKAHIHPARAQRIWLGHRLTRAGFELGPTAVKRFKKKLKKRHFNGKKLERQLAAWYGMALF